MSEILTLQAVFKSAGYRHMPHIVRSKQFRISLKEMTAPVINHDGRIAVAVYGHGSFVLGDIKDHPPVTSVKGVILFKQHNNRIWFCEAACSNDMIASAIRWHHNNSNEHTGSANDICENCDFDGKRIKARWIEALLAGNNPLFKVGFSDPMVHKEVSDAKLDAECERHDMNRQSEAEFRKWQSDMDAVCERGDVWQ